MTARTEFGYERTSCACNACVANCRFMPGFLIPSDLERMIPSDADPFEWAKTQLLASPGALAMKDGQTFRIRTLVPAVKREDKTCIYLIGDRCAIHTIAPFGCAFFDCGPDQRFELSSAGLKSVMEAWRDNTLYAQLWLYLDTRGKRQYSPDVLRARMRRETP